MDELVALVRWALLLWGLVYIVTQSVIFRRVRMFFLRYTTMLGILLYCPSCTGFWVGALLSVYWPWQDAGMGVPYSNVLESALSGVACGGLWGVIVNDGATFKNEVKRLTDRLSGVPT